MQEPHPQNYQDRESYKWEQALDTARRPMRCNAPFRCATANRTFMTTYKHRNKQRFVVRAQANRRLVEAKPSSLTRYCHRPMRLYANTATGRAQGTHRERVAARQHSIYGAGGVVGDGGNGSTPSWHKRSARHRSRQLLTTEAIGMPRPPCNYELRWRIEGYHNVEKRHWRGAATLLITAFLAVRLLQCGNCS